MLVAAIGGGVVRLNVWRAITIIVVVSPAFLLLTPMLVSYELYKRASEIWGQNTSESPGSALPSEGISWQRRFVVGIDLLAFMLMKMAPLLFLTIVPNVVLYLHPATQFAQAAQVWVARVCMFAIVTFPFLYALFGSYCPLISQYIKRHWPTRLFAQSKQLGK